MIKLICFIRIISHSIVILKPICCFAVVVVVAMRDTAGADDMRCCRSFDYRKHDWPRRHLREKKKMKWVGSTAICNWRLAVPYIPMLGSPPILSTCILGLYITIYGYTFESEGVVMMWRELLLPSGNRLGTPHLRPPYYKASSSVHLGVIGLHSK
jgi:hypothetical protein